METIIATTLAAIFLLALILIPTLIGVIFWTSAHDSRDPNLPPGENPFSIRTGGTRSTASQAHSETSALSAPSAVESP